jgi:hypothetical protein
MPKVKRPKIREMSALELARFRLLQARRGCQRAERYLELLPPTPEIARNLARVKSVIKVTGPTWISKASLSDCAAVLRYIARDQPQSLNLNPSADIPRVAPSAP